jgi:nucleotide-binding universal stress UspA family protein
MVTGFEERESNSKGWATWRILVPLDGTEPATRILTDACEMAGNDGEVVLLHVVRSASLDPGTGDFSGHTALRGCESYLESQAARIRAQGFQVNKVCYLSADPTAAIVELTKELNVGMIAMETHGRGPAGRLAHGGIAWRAVANSPVPVMLRHQHPPSSQTGECAAIKGRRIMVPLDGSGFAERALPLACQLAVAWDAPVRLVQIVPPISTYGLSGNPAVDYDQSLQEARAYLHEVGRTLPGRIETQTCFGRVASKLTDIVESESITHVVLASHGRTGLSRVILGSVADELVQSTTIPIIVVPALARGTVKSSGTVEESTSSAVHERLRRMTRTFHLPPEPTIEVLEEGESTRYTPLT